jgi:hypothetical protein
MIDCLKQNVPLRNCVFTVIVLLRSTGLKITKGEGMDEAHRTLLVLQLQVLTPVVVLAAVLVVDPNTEAHPGNAPLLCHLEVP